MFHVAVVAVAIDVVAVSLYYVTNVKHLETPYETRLIRIVKTHITKTFLPPDSDRSCQNFDAPFRNKIL